VKPYFSPRRHREHRDPFFAHREIPMGKKMVFLREKCKLLPMLPVSR
jgi:hypothetical protein